MLSLIEQELSSLIPEEELAARYSLLAPAKRLRPRLLLTVARCYGAPLPSALIPACALEMIHTYSLIHDDLPCMDDDDLRRGQPTLHKVYPEWHALLTGDYLLTYAFELLSSSPELNDSLRVALISLFAKSAGSQGMIGGQLLDLSSPEGTRLEEMHAKKTGSLIQAALEGGALIGNAPAADRSLLSTIGREIGIAFQLVDDLLDVIGETATLGKSVGSDAKQHKTTAISLLGISKTQERIAELYKSARHRLSQLSVSTEPLLPLLQEMIERQK